MRIYSNTGSVRLNMKQYKSKGLYINECSRGEMLDSRKRKLVCVPSTGAMTPSIKDSLNWKCRPFKFLNLSFKVPKRL